MLEIDCLEALHHVKGTPMIHQLDSYVIHAIQALLRRDWDIDIKHAHWECNRMTDCLAKVEEGIVIDFYSWSLPLDFALNVLHENVSGVFFPRLIAM